MTNEGQLPMMKSMLNSALKCGFPMNLFHCYILKEDKEAAAYSTTEFKHITTRKLEVIQMNLNMGMMLWVDNDIVFFQNCLADVLAKPGGFVMQDDGWSHCTGFFLARPGMFTKQIISKAIAWIKAQSYTPNDQHAFNHVLKTTPLMITKLDREEYPNGDIYFQQGKKSKARMVHSNYLLTTADKVQRFKENGMWDESDEGFNLVNKYYI
jgi:hypothetical protein